ncbi:MAG: hypothetical protein R2789_08835 [Microthrixaceae bacterium]
MERYPEVDRAGPGLRIDDLPEAGRHTADVRSWESQFWSDEIEPGVPCRHRHHSGSLQARETRAPGRMAIRTGEPYTARHLPWYETGPGDEESQFYRMRADPTVNSWDLDQSLPTCDSWSTIVARLRPTRLLADARCGHDVGAGCPGTLGLLRCCNPVASRRADLGEALVRFGRPYPYGWWLRVQRVRRAAAAGGPGEAKPPAVAVAESDLPRGSWEPDGLELLGRAVAGGAEVVQFHDDAPAEDGSSEREVFIRPTLGPVGRRSDAPGGGALLGSPDPLGSARSVRIDEVLLHRSERPPAQVVSAPSAPDADMAVVIPSPGNTFPPGEVFAGLEREPNVVEVVVVDNTLPSPAMEELQREWSGRINLQVVRTDPEAQFNYSRANNVGADATTAPVLAFCNDDLEFIEHPTLARLAGWLEVPGIGVVGPQLRYPDGRSSTGVVIGLNGLAEHALTHMSPNTQTLLGNTDDPRDVSAVTGACLVTNRRDVRCRGWVR